MTKEELIAKMAASAGITKVAAGTALQAFTGAVTTSLKKGQRVSLVNFGRFTVAERKAPLGRNRRTGDVRPRDGIRDLNVTGVQTLSFSFSSRRRHTRSDRDWSSDVCSSDRSEEHTSELQSQAEDGIRDLIVTGVQTCALPIDRKSTRLNSSHDQISYAVFCLKNNIEWSSDRRSPDESHEHTPKIESHEDIDARALRARMDSYGCIPFTMTS